MRDYDTAESTPLPFREAIRPAVHLPHCPLAL